MIGFAPDLQNIRNASQRDREKDETKDKDKKVLYETLVRMWYLPPYTSKGMTREYLVKVFHGEVFRIDLMTMRRFELELPVRTLKRTAMQNNGLLVRKLNKLLQAREQPELGFDAHEPPEQRWLLSVARYIDRTNISETFEEAVEQEPGLRKTSPTVSRVHHGRIEACRYLMQSPEVQRSRTLWDSLRQLSDQYRAYQSYELSIEVLARELQDAQQKFFDMQRLLEQQIMRTGLTYSALVNPKICADNLIGTTGMEPEQKAEIMENCKM